MLLVDRLPSDAQRLRDRLPRPSERPGVVDVQLFELLDQVAQRSHRRQPQRRVSAVHRLAQPRQFLHLVSLG